MRKILIFAVSLLLLGSCDEFLDVNDNPNNPAAVDDYLLLPAAQASVSYVMSADYGLLGGFWSQHWAQNNTSSQYKSYETYTLSSTDNIVDRPYRELYFGGLADNEEIHRKAKEEENWGLYLMTSTLKAYAFQYLVDLYDNVPYHQAFNGKDFLLNPEINTGQEVYTAIYNMLDSALMKDTDEFVDSRYHDYDLFFEANLADWERFANSLKLRILLRQYEANTSFVVNELNDLLANGSFLNHDVQNTNFLDQDSKSNPLYESDQRQLNTQNNIRANATFTSFMKTTPDSRLQHLFDAVGGGYEGLVTGSYEVPSTEFEAPDETAHPHWSATMPINVMTVAESEFLLAEAYLRTNDISNAQDHYEAGLTASYTRIVGDLSGDTMANGTQILDTLIADFYAFPATGTEEEQLEAIIVQKWVDCADGQRGIESFIERVRTGYPKDAAQNVQDAVSAGLEADLPGTYVPGTFIYSKKGATGGNFPIRLPYPNSEIGFNSSAAAYKDLIDAEVMQSKVWWNK